MKAYPFQNILLKDDLNNYTWHFKHRGKNWEHFFNQYGMNKIFKDDFLNLLKLQDGSSERKDIALEVELYQNILKGDYFVDDKKGMVNTRGAAQKVFSDQVKKCYGFIYVDKHDDGTGTMKRSPKDSFYWYQKVIQSNGQDLD